MEQRLATALSLSHDARVLDAGSGMGDVSRSLAARHGLRIEGIDILDFNIEEAKRRADRAGLKDRVTYAWGDFHDLKFSDATFDGVYTMETLVHSAHPRQVLAEFYRVLKPGGRLALFEYSRRPDNALSPDALGALRKVCERAAMPAWLEFVDGALEEMLGDSGFVDVSSDDLTAQMLPMVHAFSVAGTLPLAVMRRLNKEDKAINSMSGVEMYKYRGAWSYKVWTAQK
jgi:ubiquinone/menaquinone biosynthesis C-methylase UbiE